LPASAAGGVERSAAGRRLLIKELDAGYALPQLACQSFWATEAALSLGVLTHNLVVLFERKLGWLQAVTIAAWVIGSL
jgi:hypothetical protein